MYFQHSIKSQFLTGHKPPRKPNFKSKKGAETSSEIKNNTRPPRPEAKQWPGGLMKGPTANGFKVEPPPEQKTLAESGLELGGSASWWLPSKELFLFLPRMLPW